MNAHESIELKHDSENQIEKNQIVPLSATLKNTESNTPLNTK